jgi:transposase
MMARIQGKTTSEEYQYFAGVDVSKAHLDLHRHGTKRGQRFANDDAGIAALLATLTTPHLVVFEPTGRFHIGLWRALVAAGHGAVPQDPARARHLAIGLGVLAKTDRLDAMVLARIAAQVPVSPKAPPCDFTLTIMELFSAQRAAIKRRAMVRTQRAASSNPVVMAQLDAEEATQTTVIKSLTAALQAEFTANPRTRRTREIVMSIPGLAEGAAAAILARLPEIGSLGRGEIAALSATAPMSNESGTRTGQARPKGGRRDLKSALHMCAVSAMTHNKDLSAFADSLRKRGKHGNTIINAVLRKLIVLANALVAQDRLWTPNRP